MNESSSSGNGHKKVLEFAEPPRRVVSLVPSLTESLFDLGIGDAMVGITDYCVRPLEALEELPRIGGTKDPRLDDIVDLQPDLILANWEENTRHSVETLEAAGMPVWVTFPKTVRQALDVLWTLVGLFRSRSAAMRLETLELTLDWAVTAATERPPVRYFCPIWYGHTQSDLPWWMTFNNQTYCHDILQQIGGENVFADRVRRYPLSADLGLEPEQDAGERDTRYPRLTRDEIQAAQPEVILLPDEPYEFVEATKTQLQELLADTPAVRQDRIHLLDGSLITWHGTRLAHALRELPVLLDFSASK
jgi:ABC-type Fe3+-hydroxamate transport system substrate-binding protein